MDFVNFSAMHETGVQLGKTVALYGLGFSIGRNIILVFRGKVRGGVAMAHVLRDTAVVFGVGYLFGALGGSVINLARKATGTTFPSFGGTTNSGGNSEMVSVATDLSAAAENLVEKVTRGVFDMISSASSSVGTTATMATQDTFLGNVVGVLVSILGAAGVATGNAVIPAVSSILLGALVGLIFALIFDR